MAINLNNFVNVNINYRETSSVDSTRDTVVLIKTHSGTSTVNTQKVFKYGEVQITAYDDTYTDIPSATGDINVAAAGTELYYYYAMYFKNGGKKLRVISVAETPSTALEPHDLELFTKSGTTYTAVAAGTAFVTDTKYYKQLDEDQWTEATPANLGLYLKSSGDIYYLSSDTKFYGSKSYYSLAQPNADTIKVIAKALDYQFIVITSTCDYLTLNDAAYKVNYNEDKEKDVDGGEMKKFIAHITPEEYLAFNPENPVIHNLVRNYDIKYGLAGIEMTIAAYLSQINVDEYESVQDYAFTKEKVSYSYTSGNEVITVGGPYDDNDLVAELLERSINVTGTLVNKTSNLGGNDYNTDNLKDDLVNTYMLILLNQTIAEKLVNILATKVKYNEQGLSKIGSALGIELDRYVNNGYIAPGEIWTDDDLTYKNISIIQKGTILPLGYKFVILPFSTLTEEERKQHKLPTIYIILADSYSIRKIEVVGEVF